MQNPDYTIIDSAESPHQRGTKLTVVYNHFRKELNLTSRKYDAASFYNEYEQIVFCGQIWYRAKYNHIQTAVATSWPKKKAKK